MRVLAIAAIVLSLPFAALAQGDEPEFFEARVLRAGAEGTVVRALDGSRAGDELEIAVLEGFEVAAEREVSPGDRVLVAYSPGPDGGAFFIADHVRRGSLAWLFGLFVAAVLLVGRKKGLRALVILALTVLIILKFIVPLVLDGRSPVLVASVGSAAILFLAIFGTEGLSRKSRIAFWSILGAFGVTLALSWIFTRAARLSGIASDEAMSLLDVAGKTVSLEGLLLAGILIGALGVLDDVVMSQVSVVQELSEIDGKLSRAELFRRGMNVGVDHINAVVNTLFLAYAGASLPLLVLFAVDIPPFLTFSQTVNNEIVATEIVRTLVGSIGLVLAVPIATWVAARAYAPKAGR